MNLNNTIHEIDDLDIYYETAVLLQLCEYYQKELSMKIYMEQMGYYMENDGTPQSNPENKTETASNDNVDTNVDVTAASQSEPEKKQELPVPVNDKSNDASVKADETKPTGDINVDNTTKETSETNTSEPGLMDKIINTLKRIFMFIPNLISKCIEKIVDKRLAEHKQQLANIVDNMSDQDVDALLQKIEERKNSETQSTPEVQQNYAIHDFRSLEEIYQELGTAIGVGLGAKDAREIASNELARQNVMASATGNDNLSNAELTKNSALGAIEPVAKKAASIGVKTAAVAGTAALGGNALLLTGVGLLAGIAAGKLWDKVSNSIKDLRDKNKITQLPRYELIEKACQSKDQELDEKIQLLQNGIKKDPNAQNNGQSLQNILQSFSLVKDKEAEQTIRVLNLWNEKFIKPDPLFQTQNSQPQQNTELIPEQDSVFLDCERFTKDMNEQTFNPLLNDMKTKSEQIVNWFNDPRNPIFGVQTDSMKVSAIAYQARLDKGIAEDPTNNGIKEKIVGILTKFGQSIMDIISTITTIIRIGSDMIQTVMNAVNLINTPIGGVAN